MIFSCSKLYLHFCMGYWFFGKVFARTATNISMHEKTNYQYHFFGKSHLYYQQLVSFEKMFESLIAQEIRALKHSFLVLSHTRRSGHYKSADAVREEITKESKWDLVGVPN